jgi:2-polyprenyl-3-methyl-5-hydroxy-6-metoxy-1,4-benzoquinol methylase
MDRGGTDGGSDLRTDHDAVYGLRFESDEWARRSRMWKEIDRHLQRYIPRESAVLDIGADRGLFIGHIDARERWASDIRDMSGHMPDAVRFVQSDGLALASVLPAGHFDRIFMSNYLEHLLSAEAVIEQMRVTARLLRGGGQVIILQPNIRLIGGSYWDFIDHKVALTERSLDEAAQIAGLRPLKTITRFLPYTTKSRLPQSAFLVRAYLAMPLAWRLLGKQTLFIAERPA